MADENFDGCKLALFYGSLLLVYKRDALPSILYPGLLDLPGGGRESGESPEQCVLRELHEEFGLVLPPNRLRYRQPYTPAHSANKAYFFVADLTESELDSLCFGTEGQFWGLMEAADYAQHPLAIGHLRRLVGSLFKAT